MTLSLVLQHSPTESWDLRTLTTMKALGRDFRAEVEGFVPVFRKRARELPIRRTGKVLAPNTSLRPVPCGACGKRTTVFNPFIWEARCKDRECYGTALVTMSEARKAPYKLTDELLHGLDYIQRYHPMHRTYVTLFSLSDVLCAAMIAHDADTPADLERILVHDPAARRERRRQEIWEKRKAQLQKVVDRLSIRIGEVLEMEAVDHFMRGGRDAPGIREIARILAWYRRAEEIHRSVGGMHAMVHASVEMIVMMLHQNGEDATVRAIRQRTKQGRAREARRDALVDKLGEHGLELRSDSRLCNEFVEHGAWSIGHVVDVMRNMDFVHTRTDYPRMMREELDKEYDMCRLLGERYEDFVDRDAVSLRCQKMAVRKYARDHEGDAAMLEAIPPGLAKMLLR